MSKLTDDSSDWMIAGLRAECRRARLAIRTIRDALGCEPGDDPAEKAAALRARVAELEADAPPETRVDPNWLAGVIRVAQARGAEAMRERAAEVLDGMVALDEERAAEDARLGDERGAVFWRGRATRFRTAAARIRALPLDADAGEEGDHG